MQSRECRGDDCPDPRGTKPKYLLERSRRRDQSRQRVEAVALDLFTRRGFSEVTVEQVCAEAGIATATFYRYFSSKEDVFFGYESLFLDEISRCVERVDISTSPSEQVSRFVEGFAAFLETQRESLARRDGMVRSVPALWARTMANQRHWELTVATSLAARRGHEEPDEDDELDASLCLVLLRGALRAWRASPSEPLAHAAALVTVRLRNRMCEG
ncbi:TetR family transcriptional regulator [Terrabacter sp. Soil811]|uniref:TetR family transcriptional regulator n=1 Tax=Terrabacter sp. Soil811 TaxID=1736419 RepID=UPI000B04A76B|nr:TetR family transcriptional regulator [Terrabacter sp. Soil811]